MSGVQPELQVPNRTSSCDFQNFIALRYSSTQKYHRQLSSTEKPKLNPSESGRLRSHPPNREPCRNREKDKSLQMFELFRGANAGKSATKPVKTAAVMQKGPSQSRANQMTSVRNLPHQVGFDTGDLHASMIGTLTHSPNMRSNAPSAREDCRARAACTFLAAAYSVPYPRPHHTEKPPRLQAKFSSNLCYSTDVSIMSKSEPSLKQMATAEWKCEEKNNTEFEAVGKRAVHMFRIFVLKPSVSKGPSVEMQVASGRMINRLSQKTYCSSDNLSPSCHQGCTTSAFFTGKKGHFSCREHIVDDRFVARIRNLSQTEIDILTAPCLDKIGVEEEPSSSDNNICCDLLDPALTFKYAAAMIITAHGMRSAFSAMSQKYVMSESFTAVWKMRFGIGWHEKRGDERVEPSLFDFSFSPARLKIPQSRLSNALAI